MPSISILYSCGPRYYINEVITILTMVNLEMTMTEENRENQLVITREFAVSKSLLFEALTEHEYIKKWSSPKNFDVTFSQGQLKAGGEYSYGMKSGDGPEFVMAGEYKEIARPDRLAYTQSRVGAPGPETEISITLEEHEGNTRMVFHHTGFPSKEFRDGAIQGWNDAFEKLERLLSNLT